MKWACTPRLWDLHIFLRCLKYEPLASVLVRTKKMEQVYIFAFGGPLVYTGNSEVQFSTMSGVSLKFSFQHIWIPIGVIGIGLSWYLDVAVGRSFGLAFIIFILTMQYNFNTLFLYNGTLIWGGNPVTPELVYRKSGGCLSWKQWKTATNTHATAIIA